MPDNIVLVSLDSVRADHLPTYGYDRMTTPKLNRIANNGLVFDDTFVSGVGTPVSFTGIFTGMHAHGVMSDVSTEPWSESNANMRLLAEAMQDADYYTGSIHANPLMSSHYDWSRGWDVYLDNIAAEEADRDMVAKWSSFKKTKILTILRRLGLAKTFVYARNIALHRPFYNPWEVLWDHVEEFVRTAPEPWFLWVLLVDTHFPWFAPEQYRQWGQPEFRQTHALNYIMLKWPSLLQERDPRIVNAYDNALRHGDAFVDKLDALLSDTDNTDAPMIIHSDHGDELGEHGVYGHDPMMWDTVAYVPLIMQNVGKTGRVSGPHSLLNLGSTILDLAGSDERLNGQLSYFDKDYNPSAVAIENRLTDGSILAAVTNGEWKTIYDRGSISAYNRHDDHRETVDRTTDAPEELFERLKQQVDVERDDLLASREEAAMTERLEEMGYL